MAWEDDVNAALSAVTDALAGYATAKDNLDAKQTAVDSAGDSITQMQNDKTLDEQEYFDLEQDLSSYLAGRDPIPDSATVIAKVQALLAKKAEVDVSRQQLNDAIAAGQTAEAERDAAQTAFDAAASALDSAIQVLLSLIGQGIAEPLLAARVAQVLGKAFAVQRTALALSMKRK